LKRLETFDAPSALPLSRVQSIESVSDDSLFPSPVTRLQQQILPTQEDEPVQSGQVSPEQQPPAAMPGQMYSHQGQMPMISGPPIVQGGVQMVPMAMVVFGNGHMQLMPMQMAPWLPSVPPPLPSVSPPQPEQDEAQSTRLFDSFCVASGHYRVRWPVSEAKLSSAAESAVSPEFRLSLQGHEAAFRMILYPAGGPTFAASNGRGIVTVRSYSTSNGAAMLHTFCISVGSGIQARGPVENDFSQNVIAGLPDEEAEWDLTVIDGVCTVTLEFMRVSEYQ